MHVYANIIPAQSSFWRHQVLISGPCVSDSHQNHLAFTPKGKRAVLQKNKRSAAVNNNVLC